MAPMSGTAQMALPTPLDSATFHIFSSVIQQLNHEIQSQISKGGNYLPAGRGRAFLL